MFTVDGVNRAAESVSVVAAFPSPDKAKSAMAALERSGMPSRDVRLLTEARVTTAAGTGRADARKLDWISMHILIGALVGAAIGAALMLLVVAVLFDNNSLLVIVGSAFAGALFGGVVGALVWIGSRTPRHPQAWDTYLLAHHDETCLAVSVRDDAEDARITTILRREGAASLERIPFVVGS
jgi:hypothetical protein